MRRTFLLAARPGEGPFTQPTAGAQAWRPQLVFMPHSRRPSSARGLAGLDGYLPLAPRVSSVRYPIRQLTFKHVATVQSVTDETCQQLTLVNQTSRAGPYSVPRSPHH